MRYLLLILILFPIAIRPQPAVAKPSASTVEERVKNYGPTIANRVRPYFDHANIDYPPKKLLYVVFKNERRLKVFAPDRKDNWVFIAQYPLAKLSGKSGPKLREGDLQIPEGIYQATHLNPASKFWLSIGINYPNQFDRKMANSDGRKKLGGDIMIHGYWYTTGCIAVGNAAIEDLFIMAALTKPFNVKIIIAPTDFRITEIPTGNPRWTKELYSNVKTELRKIGDQALSPNDSLICYPDAYDPEEILLDMIKQAIEWIIKATKSVSECYMILFKK